MPFKIRKRYKRTLIVLFLFFLLLNQVVVNQAYHLTHFYEHGTVKSIEEQTTGFGASLKLHY